MAKFRDPGQSSFDSLYTRTSYLGLYNTFFLPHEIHFIIGDPGRRYCGGDSGLQEKGSDMYQ